MQGTRLSVRRRQVTMQTAHEAPVGAVTAPLSSAVFDEPPDPNALTDISTTVALLPSECGYPTDPFAGAGDVQVRGLQMQGLAGPQSVAACLVGRLFAPGQRCSVRGLQPNPCRRSAARTAPVADPRCLPRCPAAPLRMHERPPGLEPHRHGVRAQARQRRLAAGAFSAGGDAGRPEAGRAAAAAGRALVAPQHG